MLSTKDNKADARQAGIAQEHARGRAEGHAEGLAAGLAEGRRQAAEEFAELRTAVLELKQNVEIRSRGLDQQSSRAMASFVLEAFTSLVGAAARITPEVFASLLTQARQAAGSSEPFRIEADPELAGALTERLGFTVESNPSLDPGTVLTQTPTGEWSASLFAEFRQLLEQALAAEN